MTAVTTTDLQKAMPAQSDSSKNKKPSEPKLTNPVGHSLNQLSNEEILNQVANSPCASREVPESQSLEDYLLQVEPKKRP